MNGMQQLLAAQNRAKSKTSKKWKNLIFAHADFDHTSNEIRRGRKFQVQKMKKSKKKELKFELWPSMRMSCKRAVRDPNESWATLPEPCGEGEGRGKPLPWSLRNGVVDEREPSTRLMTLKGRRILLRDEPKQLIL